MTSAVLLAATIALELVVPLGYAVWLAYFLAVGVTVFQRSARAPFVVAVNCFEGAKQYELEDVQLALNLDEGVPVLLCDARERESSKNVLITLLQHANELGRRKRIGV